MFLYFHSVLSCWMLKGLVHSFYINNTGRDPVAHHFMCFLGFHVTSIYFLRVEGLALRGTNCCVHWPWLGICMIGIGSGALRGTKSLPYSCELLIISLCN